MAAGSQTGRAKVKDRIILGTVPLRTNSFEKYIRTTFSNLSLSPSCFFSFSAPLKRVGWFPKGQSKRQRWIFFRNQILRNYPVDLYISSKVKPKSESQLLLLIFSSFTRSGLVLAAGTSGNLSLSSNAT